MNKIKERLIYYVNELIKEFEKLGYTPKSISTKRNKLVKFVEYIEKEGVEFKFEIISKYMKDNNWKSSSIRTLLKQLFNFIYHENPFYREEKKLLFEGTELLQRLQNLYLKHISSNNKAQTIKKKLKALNNFLIYLEKNKVTNLTEINNEIIINYYKSLKICEDVKYLLHFLDFLYKQKIITTNYKLILKNKKRKTKLPDFYTENEIICLLKSINRDTPKGKRDYAIILVAIKLGLRSSDIINLKFDNIDFNNKIIAFKQLKTSVFKKEKIPDDVFDSIIDYIKNGRPNQFESEFIFLRTIAPIKKMESTFGIIDNYFKLANIETSNKKHGLHSLRASLATALINEGISFNTVSDILGHAKLSSTINNYIRIDFENLRTFALEITKPNGKFKKWLGDYDD